MMSGGAATDSYTYGADASLTSIIKSSEKSKDERSQQTGSKTCVKRTIAVRLKLTKTNPMRVEVKRKPQAHFLHPVRKCARESDADVKIAFQCSR